MKAFSSRLYSVYDDDGFFGKIGAQTQFGEIPWATTGTAGTVGYSTNGKRSLLRVNNQPFLPTFAYDSTGKNYTQSGFNGVVVKLRYPSAIPTAGNIGAYYQTFIGRLVLQVQSVDTGILSNTILLDLQTPPEIIDETGIAGYLRPDTINGRLNTNRLGGAPILPINVNTSRY